MRNIFPDADGEDEPVSTLRHRSTADRYDRHHASELALRAGDDEGTKTFGEFLLLVRRRKWMIGICTILGTMAVMYLAYSSKPEYTAIASLIIEPSSVPIEGLQAASEGLSIDPASIITQVDVIRSKRMLTALADDLKLYQEPDLNPTLKDDDKETPGGFAAVNVLVEQIAATKGLIKELAATTGLEQKKVEKAPPDPHVTRELVVENINRRFVAAQQGEGRVIKLKFTYPDRVVAANVVNRAADLYIESQLEEKLTNAGKVAEWVSHRLQVLHEEVRKSEDKVENYRAQNGLNIDAVVRPDQLELTRLNSDLLGARSAYFELKSKLDTVARLEQQGNTDALMSILSSPLLATLGDQQISLQRLESEYRTTYGINHPKMTALRTDQESIATKIDNEIKNAKLNLQRQVEIASNQLDGLNEQIAQNESKGYQESAAKVGLRELEREAEANRTLLTIFLQQYKEIEQQSAIIKPDAKVISYAQPPGKPSSLNPKLFVMLGFVISLTTSGLLVMILDALDGKVRSMRQIQQRFGIKVLGAVPFSSSVNRHGASFQYILDHPMSQYAEALRLVVTSLELTDHPTQVLLIASALSGEGKSTFAVALATSAARSGKRVVVVDLDLRHPCIHEVASVKQPLVGITEVVIDGESLEDALVESEAGIDCLLNSGRSCQNPGGVITDPGLKTLISDLRLSYDMVIIDTPPILAVGDSRTLSRIVDGVILCMRWGETSLSACRLALKGLTDVDASIIGSTLMAVDFKKFHLYENEDGANYYKNVKKYYVK